MSRIICVIQMDGRKVFRCPGGQARNLLLRVRTPCFRRVHDKEQKNAGEEY